MKTAIVTGDYHVPGETFINRHIALLFGGATCVVAGRFHGLDPIGRPVFARRAPLVWADRLRAPFAMGLNRVRYSTTRLPFGTRKRDLAAFLRDQGVEVILAEFGTQALALAPLAREMDLPIFSYFRGTDASKALRRRQIVAAYRKMFPHLTGIFTVSQFLLDNLASHGLRHQNAHVIPSGVDVRRFRPGSKAPMSCLCVGRMVEKKAPLVTLRGFAAATRDLPEARLTMVGDGPLLAPARALATELGVADRVDLPGALPHDAVRDHLARAQLFLQHSVTDAQGNTEGLPTAIQEAMAAGCVPVSTRHAGIPEAVTPGETGYLVKEHDTEGFTAAIAQALSDPDAAGMARAARATAEARFDNDALLSRLEAEIRRSVAP